MRQHYRIESPIGGLILVAAQGGLVGVYHERHDPQPGAVLLGERWEEYRQGDRQEDQAGQNSKDPATTLNQPGAPSGAPTRTRRGGTAGREVSGPTGREDGGSLSGERGGTADREPGVVLLGAARQLEEYFAGTRRSFELLLLPAGTGFQHRVWAMVARIPYGQTRTYRNIAAALGNAAMGRAVGAAVRANPLSILIPGHRVVAGNGALAGYAAGIDAKRFLLDLEGTAVSEGINTAQTAGAVGGSGKGTGPAIATAMGGTGSGSAAATAGKITGPTTATAVKNIEPAAAAGESPGKQKGVLIGAPVGRDPRDGAE
ncbi:methylated-DNA--[protein]-cysteine S-methyltransferase [Arthrobacter sp. TMN-37]